jgi:hypothetical protein
VRFDRRYTLDEMVAEAPRPLTPLELQFLVEAEAGFFRWLFDEETGAPFAWGAPGTGNLFSMEIVETDSGATPRESIYRLPEEA